MEFLDDEVAKWRATRPKRTVKKDTLRALQGRLTLSDAELTRVVRRLPQVFGYSYERKVAPSLEALQDRFAISDVELKKAVMSWPSLLSLSYENNVAPSLEALQSCLGLSDAEVRRVFLYFPAVAGYSFEKKVRPSLSDLGRRLSLEDEQLRRVIVKTPSVIGYKAEALTAKLDALKEGLGFSDDELRAIILKFPQLLTMSFHRNVAPKLAYFRTELNLTATDLRRRVATHPTVLAYSLEGRYKPRTALCEDLGLDVALVLQGAQLTDDSFKRWLARQGHKRGSE